MLEHVRTPLLVTMIAAILGGTACAQEPSTDAAVATKIEHRFSDDRGINAQAIEISVRKGNVVLTGRVPNEDAKERAGRLASAVDGVVRVDNRLTPAVGGAQPVGSDRPGIPDRMPEKR